MNLQKTLTRAAILTLLIFGIFDIAQAQRDPIYRLPAGTRIKLKLDAALSSNISSVNDTFIASVAQPVMNRDVIVLPVGTSVEGRVTDARAAGAGGRRGKLDLSFISLRFSDELVRTIDGTLVKKPDAGSSGSFKLLSIFGGTGLGALLGGISRSGKGILIGTGIGAGIGTAIAMSRKGKDVRIEKNVEFEIELKKEVVLPVLDY